MSGVGVFKTKSRHGSTRKALCIFGLSLVLLGCFGGKEVLQSRPLEASESLRVVSVNQVFKDKALKEPVMLLDMDALFGVHPQGDDIHMQPEILTFNVLGRKAFSSRDKPGGEADKLKRRLISQGVIVTSGEELKVRFADEQALAEVRKESPAIDEMLEQWSSVNALVLDVPPLGFVVGETYHKQMSLGELSHNVTFEVLGVGDSWITMGLKGDDGASNETFGWIKYRRRDGWPLEGRLVLHLLLSSVAPKSELKDGVLKSYLKFSGTPGAFASDVESMLSAGPFATDLLDLTLAESKQEELEKVKNISWPEPTSSFSGQFSVEGRRVAIQVNEADFVGEFVRGQLVDQSGLQWVNSDSGYNSEGSKLSFEPAGWGDQSDALEQLQTLSGEFEYGFRDRPTLHTLPLVEGRQSLGRVEIHSKRLDDNQWQFTTVTPLGAFGDDVMPLLVKDALTEAKFMFFAPTATYLDGEPQWLNEMDREFSADGAKNINFASVSAS